MIGSREGERQPIPISARIVRQQAQQTVRNLIDAVVELLTNSDDSYRRLEEGGERPGGRVAITVKRRKGGEWEFLEVRDQAEGMTIERLLDVVAYGEAESGFEVGRSVRGMFGRGLKEAAIALGEALVRSVKKNTESEVRIWWDDKAQKAMREVIKDSRATNEPNGTSVTVLSRGSQIKCPTFEKFYEQVSAHFALRDINQSKHRELFLTVENMGGGRGRGATAAKLTKRIRYGPPPQRELWRNTIDLVELGKTTVTICEAQTKLDFSSYDPCSEAGLVVKTEGASLDVELFGFDNYDAAHYFFGEVYCPGIARKVREGDYGLIDTDRSGLQWKHPACDELYKRVRELIRPHIERKHQELTSGIKTQVPDQLRKKLHNLCALLNRLARLELEIPPEEEGNGGVEPSEIAGLTIKPEVGNARPKDLRRFTVYLPRDRANAQETAPVVQLQLQETVGRVNLVDRRVLLSPHGKYHFLLTGRFQVAGEEEGDKAYIVAKHGVLEDIAEFHVRAPMQIKPRPGLTGHKGGMFKDIKFNDTTEGPPWRVSYLEGIVEVFLKFPPLSDYLGPGGKGAEKPQGSLMLAELVAEAFCREVARRKIERGERPVAVGGEIDNFNRTLNELMAKHLQVIHKALVVA